MNPIVVVSTSVVAVGLVSALTGHRRKAVVALGTLLVCSGVGALIWSRPSTKKLDDQQRAIKLLCEGVRSDLVSFRGDQENEVFRAQHPWSEQAPAWIGLASMVSHIEPLCFPDSGWPCIPERARVRPLQSYGDIKPHLDRVIHALETHTRCRAPVPDGSMFYTDDTSGFEPEK
jgi:hypothetical protein